MKKNINLQMQKRQREANRKAVQHNSNKAGSPKCTVCNSVMGLLREEQTVLEIDTDTLEPVSLTTWCCPKCEDQCLTDVVLTIFLPSD